MRRIQKLAVAIAAAALLSGCAASSTSDSSGADYGVFDGGGMDSESGLASSEEMAASPFAGAADVASDSVRASAVTTDAYLVREATLGIKVEAIPDAAAAVREIAAEAGGSVTNEQFGDDFYGPMGSGIDRFGTMTISVPSEALEATLTKLAALGEVRTRTSNAYSVQDEYIDVEARIATLEASITRMRALMGQTEDIKQIIELETALSARQADLDSLQARLNGLKSQIAMSPISVMLTTSDDLGQPQGGIVGALRDAWNAFTSSAAALITTIGAVLPWLVVGGVALAGLLKGTSLIRRRRTQPTPAALPSPSAPSTPATGDKAQRPQTPTSGPTSGA